MEDLDYADDLALISEGVDDVQEKIGRLVRKAKTVGLTVVLLFEQHFNGLWRIS